MSSWSWFDYCFLGLIALYAIIPVPFLRIAEHRFFKTRHITFVRGYALWFAANCITFLIFLMMAFLLDFLWEKFRIGLLYGESALILLFAIVLIIVFPFMFILFFGKRFSRRQIIKITLPHIAFFFIIAFTIFGLYEILRYHDKYAGAVYAKSPQKEKEEILASISEACELKFPEETRLIFAQWIKGGMVAAAKLEIDRDKFAGFESQLSLEYELTKEPLLSQIRSGFSWGGPKYLWKPMKSKQFKIWKKEFVDILLDYDDNSKVVVYLIYATI